MSFDRQNMRQNIYVDGQNMRQNISTDGQNMRQNVRQYVYNTSIS